MNLSALDHIVKNNPELIDENVPAKADSAATLGVAKLVLGNGGNVDALTDKQRFHFDTYILPLIENVECDGVFGPDMENGEDGCVGSGRIDDEDLEGCYIMDEMLCQECQHVNHKMQED
ncbi:hypothetical protein [Pseudomonas sp. LG1D9]|uniref:hypothetical protein n=1 Tax=Pseudomonas sp. LG1D9 TaxID=2083054 RepID=UPI000CF32664|nr:hypothetical protein [Pseudomonas sp. LG1D9]